ncbi:hypothetical protein GmHk_20G057051 [Glycine max]|nr:hypothetical protein GmHk_20G057051 [Glycine max]
MQNGGVSLRVESQYFASCKWVDINIGVRTDDFRFTYNAHGYTTQLPPPPESETHSPSTLKRTKKETRVRSLATRPIWVERPLVHVDPATRKANGPHRKKLRTYMGIVARDKVDVTMKKKILQTVGERCKQFKLDLTLKWALIDDKEGDDDTVCEKYDIRNEKWNQFCQSRKDPSWEMFERRRKPFRNKTLFLTCCLVGEAAQFGSTDTTIDPPFPIRRHMQWKMACTNKTSQMTFEAVKEIADRIVSHFHLPVASQGSFVAHGCQDVLTSTIGRPEHLGCIRAAGVGIMIKQYFEPVPRTSCTSSSMTPEDLEQLTQEIRDQLEESIIEKVTR